MLFAGWEVRMVKNCDRGLENAAEAVGITTYNNINFFLNLTKYILKEPE